jgi:BCD family chlorophyll transporter-like MFS transporter
VQASSAGLAIALGGALRDGITSLATHGSLGVGMNGPATGYSVVYNIEILFLFATLIAIGPLVRRAGANPVPTSGPEYKLAELPQ